MFKHKSRPKNQRKLESDQTDDKQHSQDQPSGTDPDTSLAPVSLEDLIALRNLRRAKGGIDAAKLAAGDPKKRKRVEDEDGTEEVKYGLQKPKDEEDALADESEKVRRSVRKNYFTQQTNALDVDKHMMAYIEENLKLRKQSQQGDTHEDASSANARTEDGMLKFGEKYKTHNIELKEGSVTNSLAMLSAIPEVDLGMDARLRNIEETEKAKRAAAEEKAARLSQRIDSDEARLAATRFYNPHLRQESDEALLKKAKLQAMGIDVSEKPQRRNNDRPEMATDEVVMERFKKRMRR